MWNVKMCCCFVWFFTIGVLNVQSARPAKVENLGFDTATLSSTAMTITWSESHGMIFDHYNLTIEPSVPQPPGPILRGRTAWTIRGLAPSTTYTVAMKIQSNFFQNQTTSSLRVRTLSTLQDEMKRTLFDNFPTKCNDTSESRVNVCLGTRDYIGQTPKRICFGANAEEFRTCKCKIESNPSNIVAFFVMESTTGKEVPTIEMRKDVDSATVMNHERQQAITEKLNGTIINVPPGSREWNILLRSPGSAFRSITVHCESTGASSDSVVSVPLIICGCIIGFLLLAVIVLTVFVVRLCRRTPVPQVKTPEKSEQQKQALNTSHGGVDQYDQYETPRPRQPPNTYERLDHRIQGQPNPAFKHEDDFGVDQASECRVAYDRDEGYIELQGIDNSQ